MQKRQAGGIGSATYDPKQSDIRKFFGGGNVTVSSAASDAAAPADGDAQLLTEEGRAASNACDETVGESA